MTRKNLTDKAGGADRPRSQYAEPATFYRGQSLMVNAVDRIFVRRSRRPSDSGRGCARNEDGGFVSDFLLTQALR